MPRRFPRKDLSIFLKKGAAELHSFSKKWRDPFLQIAQVLEDWKVLER